MLSTGGNDCRVHNTVYPIWIYRGGDAEGLLLHTLVHGEVAKQFGRAEIRVYTPGGLWGFGDRIVQFLHHTSSLVSKESVLRLAVVATCLHKLHKCDTKNATECDMSVH